MAGEPTRRGSEATRERVLAATIALLAERGTAATGLNQIVEASGVSYGSVYNQFRGGKDALVAAAVERAGDDIGEALRAVFVGAASLPDACRTMFDFAGSMLESSDFASGCPVGTAVGDGHVVGVICEASANAFSRWAAIVADGAIGFGARADEAAEFASSVVSLYEGSLLVSRATRSVGPIVAAGNVAVVLAERVAS